MLEVTTSSAIELAIKGIETNTNILVFVALAFLGFTIITQVRRHT